MQGAKGCYAIGNEMVHWYKAYLFSPPLSALRQTCVYIYIYIYDLHQHIGYYSRNKAARAGHSSM